MYTKLAPRLQQVLDPSTGTDDFVDPGEPWPTTENDPGDPNNPDITKEHARVGKPL